METVHIGTDNQPMNLLKAIDTTAKKEIVRTNEKAWKLLTKQTTKKYGEGKNKKLEGIIELETE